jgi:DNA repair photolyase
MMRTFADVAQPGRDSASGQLPLALQTARAVTTPEFAGMTFLEVETRSALNKVSGMPFAWSINPYRGCSHACSYCFARPTHRYLELSPGADFERKIVVKTNVVEVLRAELARPRWRGEKVALGTNTDPYQRCEGRYALLPGIIGALADANTPLSILTKGTLITRDRALLAAAAQQVEVTAAFTVGMLDDDAWRASEPGTPHPRARLDAVRALNDAGVPTGVMLAPIMPGINDDHEQLAALIDRAAVAGATHITAIVLHLRRGVREVFWPWLEQAYPALVARYATLYRGSQAPRDYRDGIQRFVAERRREAYRRHGQPAHAAPPRFGSPPRSDSAERVSRAHAVEQLRLL